MNELPTIHQLECFIIYGRIKNFSLAAQEANITQSAFSVQMKKLEEAIGVTLIRRSTRGSDLTEAGMAFLAKAQICVEQLREAVAEVQESAKRTPVELDVAVLRSLGDVHMNRHVSYFQKQNEKICLNVFEMEEDEIRCGLLEDRIDVASLYRLDDKGFNGWECVHFSDDDIVFYAPCLARVEGDAARSWVAQQPHVFYPVRSSMNRVYERYFGEEKPVVVARLSTPYAMVHFCRENAAGVLLPRRFVEALGITDGFSSLAPALALDAVLVYKRDNPRLQYIRTYVEHVRQIYREKPRSQAGEAVHPEK